ncbi:MAG: hypothetical protein ACOZF0_11890 [Thermodesulfobacteriota bacterium]
MTFQPNLYHSRKEWETIDLVILDLTMPRLDGRETFNALRRQKHGKRPYSE